VGPSDSSAPLRCALCHADLEEPSLTCPSCKTVLHSDCRAELARCPTLGCKPSAPMSEPMAPASQVELVVLLLVVLLPSLPFLVLPVPFRYYCTDPLVTRFDLTVAHRPLKAVLDLPGVSGRVLLLNRWRRRGGS